MLESFCNNIPIDNHDLWSSDVLELHHQVHSWVLLNAIISSALEKLEKLC